MTIPDVVRKSYEHPEQLTSADLDRLGRECGEPMKLKAAARRDAALDKRAAPPETVTCPRPWRAHEIPEMLGRVRSLPQLQADMRAAGIDWPTIAKTCEAVLDPDTLPVNAKPRGVVVKIA